MSAEFWDAPFFRPQPQQDSQLLQTLGFLPGFKELLLLRQVHALEHATVWVLSEIANQRRDNESLGGLSTEQGFYLYGQVNPNHLYRAVPLALQRLQQGEWQLAIHPRCGTNLSSAIALTAGLVLGTHWLLPRFPLTQLLGMGLAGAIAAHLAPELGSSAQKYLTTAIPFNLKIARIFPTQDIWGRSAYFVGVRWQELQ